MEIPDVTVYVLYDFDYQTKDGRRIEIKTGERLFLIKKTNNDWWQVIRSSERRPFYVPASYVEEVHKSSSGSYKHENKKQNFPKPRTSLSSSPSEITSQQKSIKCITGETFLDTASNLPSYRNRSFSLEDKRVIHNSSDKYSIDSVGNSTLSSSGYESLCEAVSISDSNNTVIPLNRLQQEEVDYVNLRQDGDGFGVDETSNSETAQTQLKAADGNNTGSNCDDKAVLSGRTADNVNTQGAITGRLNSTKLEIVPSVTGGCYSNIIMCSDNSRKSGGFNGNSDLPLSSSLEELNEQIKVKTDKLRNVSNTGNGNSVICITDSGTIRQHHYDDSVNNHIIKGKSEAVSCESSCVNSIKKHSDIVSDVADRVKILNNKSEDSDTSSCKSDVDYKKLQYVGSFKTKQERQKWAKQHFEQCGLRNTVEAEKNKTEQSEQLDNICTLDMVNVENTDKIGGSSTMVGKVSTAVVIEKARKVEESMQQMEAVQRKDIMEINKNKTSSRHSLDSIAEDEWTDNKTKDEIKPLFGKSHQQQGSSDKGSLESLLDIDRNSGRKISGGNTSDSLVPTDGEDLYMDNSDSETDSIVLGHSRLRSDAVDNREYKQKVLLMRNRRVDNKGRQYPMQAPPSPTTTQAPSRMLFNGWNEYLTEDNRKFFYNLETKEKSWKPPRRRYNSNSEKQANSGSLGNIYSDSSSPLAETDEILTNFQLPAGWRTQLDEDTGLPCYINIVTGAKWFSSSDSEGRLYFFEVNSDESSWTLPITTPQIVNENTVNDGVPTDVIQTLPVVVPQSERNVNSRPAKAKSMIITDRREELAPLAPTVPRNWPQLWDGHMCVLKEGPLNRTKITENGKRLRKNWASTYVVLTELFLLFFKDSKTFTAMKSGGGRPELCVDLNGAVIDRGDKKSSRKNVYMISTVLELQVLIQCDCQSEAEQWLTAIELAIHNLPLAHDRCPRIPRVLHTDGGTSPEDNKKGSKILRVKSLKMKHKDESMEDLSVNPAERQTKIKERLKKFFHRRPTMESLVKKGIWKDEPVFGCYLEQVCGPEFPRVPLFVQRCIQCIERNVENMKTDGLYRASGNLSQVQKIRLQVDQNNYSVLEQEEDVHVLTSALKLFFRELKQPLIPFHLFSKALKASTNHNRKEKLKEFREIVKALPTPNHDTLKYLLQHLLQVTKYQGDKESNRMHIPNLAIVFGPTLMWPEQESLNMAFDMMQQNLVIECFLAEFDYIFR